MKPDLILFPVALHCKKSILLLGVLSFLVLMNFQNDVGRNRNQNA